MELVYDERAKGFQARIEVAGAACDLTLLDFGEGGTDAATALAVRIEAFLNASLDATKGYAADSLLELKNETWRDEDEPPLDAAAFVGRLTLEGVNAFSNGTFEVYFDDGDLFWGHSVRVDVDASLAFERAELVG